MLHHIEICVPFVAAHILMIDYNKNSFAVRIGLAWAAVARSTVRSILPSLADHVIYFRYTVTSQFISVKIRDKLHPKTYV